jgi:osmotically-inducible protein OsmY
VKALQSLKIASIVASVLFAAGASAQTMSGASSQRTDSASNGTSASSESLGQHIGDGAITAKAKAELIGAKDVHASRVHVKTRHGVVWLTGSVPRQADKQRAQEIVQGISGVQSVHNRLKVIEAGASE